MSSMEKQNKEKSPSRQSFGNKAIKIAALLLTPVVMLGSFGGCQAIKSFFNGSGSSVTDASGNTVYPPTTRYATTIRPHTTREVTTVLSEIQQKMNLAPDLEGASKVIKKINGYERVVYEAKAGNPYGVEAVTYLGEFKKEVTLEGKEVGGVALIPVVVKVLLKDGLAKIPAGRNKCLVFIPASINELSKNTIIKIETVDFDKDNLGVGLKVSFGGESVSVSNPIINGKTDGIITSNYIENGGFGTQDRLQGIRSYYAIEHENEGKVSQDYLSVYSKYSEILSVSDKTSVDFGTNIAKTSEPIYMVFNSYINVKINSGDILEVGKSPVFVVEK